MPRSSRHKHRQHHKRRDSADYYYSTDSDNDGSQSQSHSHSHGAAKGGKGRQQDTVKLKSPKQGNKEKSNRGSVVSVSDERWEGGGENALSLLAYLEKDSKADSDSSCREDNHKTRRHKSKQFGAPNGVAEIRVSSRKRETLDKDEGGDNRGKSRVKEDVDSGSRKEAVDTKKENSSVSVAVQPLPARVLEATTLKESVVAASSQTAIANEDASSQKKGTKGTEWKLQDELRNPELEKELENRILRRREESGDRDRWRDGERDREGKSYSSKDSHQRDDKYKSGKHKEDRSRGDRYKDERQEDQKSRTKRYKEEWNKDDILRTDKYKDDKQRDEKPKEDRHKDARQKDDRHKELEHREDKCKNDKNKADKNKEGKLEDGCKEEKYREDRYKDEKHRFKSKDEKYQEKLSQECTVDICDSKCSKDESRQRRHFKENNYYDSDQENSSYYNDQNLDRNDSRDKDQLSQKPDVSSLGRSHEFRKSPSEKECRETGRVCEDEASVQEILPGDTRGSNVVDAAAVHNRQKRAHDGPNIGREQKRMKAIEGRTEYKDALLEERVSLGRDSQASKKKIEEHFDHPKQLAVISTRTTTKRSLDNQRGESPPGSANSSFNSSGCLSPLQVRDRSISPSSRNKKHVSHEKMTKRKRVEHGFSSPIVRREEMDRSRSSDRCKQHSSRQVEVRHRNAGVDLKDTFTSRGRSRSTDRACSTKLENSNIDRFSRAPSVHGGNLRGGGQEEDASAVDHYSMRPFTVSGEGAKTPCHMDEVTSNKSGWSSHNIQNTRSEGFPVQQRTPPFPVRPSGHLPPPPPFRPGVDNPSVLGRSNSTFEDGPCSRDQGRADWNANAPFNRCDVKGGVRNWNPQVHGPGASNFFMSFKHQPAGLPPATFHNMGQHLGPPLFRGLRPPSDMSHGGVPYHMWENGDRNLSHNGAFGWQRQIEDVCGTHVQGSFNAWDGYVEESAMYLRRDWYQYGQGMGNRGWDRPTGTGKGHRNDTNTDFPHKESEFHGNYTAEESWGGIQDSQERHKKFKKVRSPENDQIKKSDGISPKSITKIPSLSSETKKTNKYTCDGIKFYLSRLDISQELAGPDLYNQCITIIGREQNDNSCKADFTTDMSSEDHHLEVDTDADNLISSFDLRRAVFSTLPEHHTQRTLNLYNKASKQSQNAATVDISANIQTTSTDQIDKSFAAVLRSEEGSRMADNEKPLVEMVEDLKPEILSLQHEYISPETKIAHFLDAAQQNDTKRGPEVSETAFKLVDSHDQGKFSYDANGGEISKQQDEYVLPEIMKQSGNGLDDSMGPTVLTGDRNCSVSHFPSVDSYNFLGNAKNSGSVTCIGTDSIDSKDDVEKADVKHVEDASCSSKTWLSKTPTYDCISCARSEYVGFNGLCLQCQGGNQPIADECHDTPIQQSESLEQSKLFHDEALKFDFVDSKELVSAACIVHILREVSFHVGLPAIRLPHLVEVAIANVS
ncbi:hypothetical protein SUGI_0984300 [Cryptomeria japonica]|uniref:uncharacterized protein LOC131076724 n=1 Tax=Cryptomeria japonica TaxID=3369 RepID=UPI0024149667|nr:uncharacterized protein LOC131076724 [Cryptomeria japonica]GLJ46691.1 hypothetical protein SUGI_0984300 [Cryptomeria japonica]